MKACIQWLFFHLVHVVVHADVNCGQSMHVSRVGLQMDEKVWDIDGDWEDGCNRCGNYLEDHQVDGFCSGWYCFKRIFGIWLMRDGGPCPNWPTTTPELSTKIIGVEGSWIPIAYTSIPKDYYVTKGVQHTVRKETSIQWTASASASLSAGFSVGHCRAYANVTGTTSKSIANTYSDILSMTTTTQFTYHCQPGQVWQFQFSIPDDCGNAKVFGMDVVQTPSRVATPCCLPGYFKDPTDPHGDCVADEGAKLYDLCKPTNAAADQTPVEFGVTVSCGSGMTVDHAGSVMDSKVENIVGDWELGCSLCGQYLERNHKTCAGWYCKKLLTGIWLKRDSTQPPCNQSIVDQPHATQQTNESLII